MHLTCPLPIFQTDDIWIQPSLWLSYHHPKCLYLSHIKALSDRYQNPKLMNVLQIGFVFSVLLFEASFPYMILMILVLHIYNICTLDPSGQAYIQNPSPYLIGIGIHIRTMDIHPKCLETCALFLPQLSSTHTNS